jgi:hypothetical protein
MRRLDPDYDKHRFGTSQMGRSRLDLSATWLLRLENGVVLAEGGKPVAG